MRNLTSSRAIAVAPTDMQAPLVTPPGVFHYALPQYFQPGVTYQPAQRGGVGSRSGVCASRHMAAEQRRRARINDRLEALRTLVPHSARANTAAFLTEVYDYISSLHKQLDRVGAGVLDLNVVASDEKNKIRDAIGEKSLKERRGASRKRARDSKSDDESEVESEDRYSSEDFSHAKWTAGDVRSDGVQEEKPYFTTVSAPSLYDPAVSKPDTPGVTRVERPVPTAACQASTDALRHDTRHSAFSPPTAAADSCSTQMTLGIGGCHGTTIQTKPRPRGMQPLSARTPPTLPSSLSTAHQGSVAATAAALAEAASAAQSWGMAAAIAQVQAQAHAQAHARALALVQAQAQVQTQTGQALTPASTKRRRRNVTGSDTCAMRHNRSSQAVVRPIAVKLQR